MFFRFAAALILVVAVSMAQVGLEKQSLRLRRAVSRQYYQKDELLELHAQLRLKIQQLTAPTRFVAHADAPPSPVPRAHPQPDGDQELLSDRRPAPVNLPLLRWERPVRPDGVTRR